ncbi:glycosyltransferase family 2 protein [Naasia sp. SYSU D00057]|uniref:glycosyltransferase family 2 protein n=1 Tax=Naasia sp. SYSU D00057 TaxID=2817380 RepID=UPI001B310FFF|nr:glycosyltransferase [Naasia sp. SYSU D00057]
MTAPTSDAPLRVVVAALTYRRPDDLAELLPALVAQRATVPDSVDILIVDNDPDAGAREQVAAFGRGVRYVHAPEPGIASARNVALDEAGDADLLVFIDDDERPVARWLSRLVDAWRRHGATAVVGPVISSFEVEPGAWIRAGGFFSRRRLPTGSPVAVAATNNLLLDLDSIRRMGLRFDLRFGLTGGSDTMFSRELVVGGGSIVWCDEAIVTDVVPASRSTRDWVLRRQFRSGNSWMHTSLALEPTPAGRARTRVLLSAAGAARVVAGAALLAAGSVTRSLRWRARGTKAVARGSGLLAGAFGSVYAEYRRAA